MREKITTYDAIILGGGPAGISAAMWCAELGLTATLLEKEGELGGQLRWTHGPIENYLGIRAENGRALLERFCSHSSAPPDVAGNTCAEVRRADLAACKVRLSDKGSFTGRAVIIATGVRRRELAIPGERKFRDRGILQSGTLARREVSGGRVVIIGGGDAALENALILSETASKVTLIHRRSEMTARDEFQSEARKRENIEFVLDTRALALRGQSRLGTVKTVNCLTGEQDAIDADFILIRIGVVPNTELFAGQIALDNRSYVITDSVGMTTLDRVYAIGDVACPHSPTISGAVGGGATAAKEIYRRLKSVSQA